MVQEMKHLIMGISIMDFMLLENHMVLGFINGIMEVFILVNLRMVLGTVLVNGKVKKIQLNLINLKECIVLI